MQLKYSPTYTKSEYFSIYFKTMHYPSSNRNTLHNFVILLTDLSHCAYLLRRAEHSTQRRQATLCCCHGDQQGTVCHLDFYKCVTLLT